MQKVDKHISELLYEHDCVIVPDLGGFVANYAPAKIHPTQHTFTPPSKNIVFNKNLKNNDGLLANFIATSENTNYQEALKYINHFVDLSYAQLKKGVKVNIDEVGVLFLDVERNIQFEPSTTNYLLDVFGMSQFQSPAIKRDTVTKRIEKEFKDRGAIPIEKKRGNVKRYVALAIVAPLVFAMIWIPLKTDLLKNINYSNLNPFASKEFKNPIAPVNPKTTVVLSSTNNDTTVTKMAVLTPVQPVTDVLVKADTTAVANSTDANLNFKFHLVAGCFQIEDNAINFVRTLKQQNIDAAIIGQNNKGLYVVSCADFATRKEALNGLENLRKLKPNAWLYRN
jgi:cell division septation protein DedD